MNKPGLREVSIGMQKAAALVQKYAGVTLVRGDLQMMLSELLPIITKRIGNVNIQAALIASMRYMEDQRFTAEELKNGFMRVIANADLINDGAPAPLWGGECTEGILLVLGVEDAEAVKGKRGLGVTVKCITGVAAGCVFNIRMSVDLVSMIMSRYTGVPDRKYNCAPEELTGMYIRASIKGEEARIVLTDYSVTPKMASANKLLTEARNSFSKCDTPEMPCNACGKTTKQCKLAVWLAK